MIQPKPFSPQSLLKKLIRMLPWLVMLGLLFYNIAFLLSTQGLGDFGSFIASGQAAQRGENPYAVYPLTSRAEYVGREETFPNMNPPVSLLLFELLAKVNPFTALRNWIILSIVIYLTGLIILFRAYHPTPIWLAWALTLAGLWDTLALGQIYTALFLLVALAWLCLGAGRELLAGVLIGILAAFKPNLLVWPGVLFLAGQRRPAFIALLTTVILSALPILRYEPQIYMQWLKAASQASWTDMPHYLSVFGVTARFGVPWLGLPLALLLLAFVGWWAWKRRPVALAASEIALIASILASPLATPRFTLFLVPVFYLGFQDPRIKLPAALFLIPTSLIIWLGFQSEPLRLLVGLIYPLALLLLFWRAIFKPVIKSEELTLERTL